MRQVSSFLFSSVWQTQPSLSRNIVRDICRGAVGGEHFQLNIKRRSVFEINRVHGSRKYVEKF